MADTWKEKIISAKAEMHDYPTAKGFGRNYRTTTFFKLKDGGIGVRCGCFYGTLDEFRKKVKETHKEIVSVADYFDWADEQKMNEQIDKKVNEALAKRDANAKES